MATETGNDNENQEDQHNTENITDIQQKIITQIEFYFGDANLPRDKFMLEQVKLDDGWIPLSTMLKFQRLARLTTDPEVIVSALKHSQLMEADTSGAEPKIRRSPEMPLPELNAERRKALIERTIYCKGFALDSDIDAVMAVVNEHAAPESILMRKYKDKLTLKYLFKGSIFVTLKTKDEAKTFLDKAISIGDKELVKMWQNEYYELKKKEFEEKSQSRAKKNGKKEVVVNTEFKKGATIKLTGAFENILREDIKEALEKLDVEPAFISYNKGDTEAFVRLSQENSASSAAEKMTGDFTIKESKFVISILEGDEEEAFLKKAEEERKQYMQRCKNARKGNSRQGGGRWQGGGQKRRSGRKDNADEPQKKKAKEAQL